MGWEDLDTFCSKVEQGCRTQVPPPPAARNTPPYCSTPPNMSTVLFLLVSVVTSHVLPCDPDASGVAAPAAAERGTAESIVLLKGPRTGSTWMASLIAQEEATLVIHELLLPRDNVLGIQEVRRKVSGISEVFHERAHNQSVATTLGRKAPLRFDASAFLETSSVCTHASTDGGIDACRSVVMSINPAVAPDTDTLAPLWRGEAPGLAPPAVLFRTNVVKHAIALFRGRCMSHRCSRSNAFRDSDGQVQCTVEGKSDVDLRTFKCLVAHQFSHADALRERTCSLAAAAGVMPFVVTYESLQQAPIATLDEMYRTLLGRPFVPSAEFADDRLVEKTTPERLADILVHPDSLLAAFETVAGHTAAENASLACLRQMYLSEDPTEFDIPAAWNEDCRPPESWMRLVESKPGCNFVREGGANLSDTCYLGAHDWREHQWSRRSVEIWLVIWGMFCLGMVQLQRRRPMLFRSITGKLDPRFHDE